MKGWIKDMTMNIKYFASKYEKQLILTFIFIMMFVICTHTNKKIKIPLSQLNTQSVRKYLPYNATNVKNIGNGWFSFEVNGNKIDFRKINTSSNYLTN